MIYYYLIIGIYLSFVLDFLIWPIPSEGSTKALASIEKTPLIKRLGYVVIFMLNLSVYLLPMALSVIGLINGVTLSANTSLPGIIVAILGRIVSLTGTYTIKSHSAEILITNYVFRYSRNPITVGIHLTLFGLALSFNIWYLWLGLVFSILNLHYKVRVEERYLFKKYPKDFKNYVKQTPRYFIW